MPSLLTSTLGASAATLGLIEGISDALAGTARLTGGALADDPQRRRKIAVGGYTTTATLAALTGAATGVWQVGLPATPSWPTSCQPKTTAAPYGFERMMDNLGAVFGPMLALGLIALLNVRWAIGLSIIPGLLAALAIIYAIRHAPKAEVRAKTPLRIRIRPVLHGQLGKLMGAVAAFEVGNIAATLLILRATELLTPDRGVETATSIALILYIGYNVAATAASLPAGRLADRLGPAGPVRVLTAGVAAFAVAYGVFALNTTNIALLVIPFVLAGIGIGAVETAQHSAVATLAPAQLRGSAFGLLATIQAFGNLAASGIAGLLWTLFSPSAAFIYLAACMFLALASLALASLALTNRRRPSPHQGETA